MHTAHLCAMVATPETLVDSASYPDSGTSRNVTPDFGNLMDSLPSHGVEQPHVGNGQGLPISNVGYSNVISSTYPSQSLTLHDLSCVPQITKKI